MEPVRDRSLQVERAIIHLVRSALRVLPGRRVAELMRDGAAFAETLDPAHPPVNNGE